MGGGGGAVVTTQICSPVQARRSSSPSQSDAPTVMKNWQPFVLGPLLACR